MIEFLFVLMFVAAIVWVSVNAFRSNRDRASESAVSAGGPAPYPDGQPYMYDAGSAPAASSSFDAPADAGSADSGGAADAGSRDGGSSGTE